MFEEKLEISLVCQDMERRGGGVTTGASEMGGGICRDGKGATTSYQE